MKSDTQSNIPVIAIDGPSASGKGTIARLLARRLGWCLLDSGALYRLVGLAARKAAVSLDNVAALERLALHLDVEFIADAGDSDTRILLNGQEVGIELRTEACGDAASRVAAVPAVRSALLARQQEFRQPPGLVADGRDMGTVVFPDAVLKVFLTASAEERAKRRHKQLREKGIAATIRSLLDEIESRDARDRNRVVAPLRAADDAVIIDTSHLGIDEVLQDLLDLCRERLGLKV